MSLHTSTTGLRRRTVLLAGAALAAAIGVPTGPASPANAATGRAAAAAGDVWSWGLNNGGQLGRAPLTTPDGVGLLPGRVSALSDVRAVTASGYSSYAIRQDRRVLSWGSRYLGRTTAPEDAPVPALVENLAGVSALSASGTHVLALRVDGTLRAWGDNSYGQIGNGGSRRDVKTPVLVREPFAEDATATRFTGATAIATGAYVSFALREDGTVWNWGSEIDGVIGTGGLQTTRPLQIPGLTGVTAIAAGPGFALALLADGTVRAWGDNSHGQLGTGDTRDRSAPVPVPGLTDVVQIDAGGYHSVARTRTGQVKTWGGNDGGQLGDSTTTNRTRPVTALGLTGITDITAGLENTFAVRADRSVVGWGSNYVRQLGIDGPAVTTPRPLPRLGAVTDIDAGHNYSLLLR